MKISKVKQSTLREEWFEETGLSRREQETARKKLIKIGILEEERRGQPARLFYRIDFERFSVCLDEYYNKSNTTEPDESKQLNISPDSKHSSMAESAILECANPPNKIGGKRHTYYTENTTEITNIDVVDVVEGRHVEKSRKDNSPLKEKNDNHFSFLGNKNKDEAFLKKDDLKNEKDLDRMHCQKQESGTNKNVTEIQKKAEKIAGVQIPAEIINRLVHEFDEEKVKEKIKMLGSVATRNAPGFLIAALENDYIFQPGRPQQQQNDRASPKRPPRRKPGREVIFEKDREKRELIKSLYKN